MINESQISELESKIAKLFKDYDFGDRKELKSTAKYMFTNELMTKILEIFKEKKFYII